MRCQDRRAIDLPSVYCRYISQRVKPDSFHITLRALPSET